MTTTISIADARSTFGDIINRAHYAGERVVLEKRGKPVAALISIADLETLKALENAADIRALEEAKAEDDGTRYTLEEVEAEINK